MQYKVLQPFNTANRRLAPSDGPGGRIGDDEVFEPFTLSDLLDRKVLEPIEENEAALVAAEPAEKPPEPASASLAITTAETPDTKPTPVRAK